MLDFDSFGFFANLFPLLLIVLPFYRVIKNVLARRLLLAAIGMYLIFLIAPRLLVFYLILWTVSLCLQWLVAATAERKRGTLIFALAVIALLVPMVIWKLWTGPFVIDFNLWTGSAVRALTGQWGAVDLVRNIILPLGLSFTTFRAIDLIIKTYLGVFDRLRADEIYFYGFFPPVLLIGPVIQYTEIKDSVQPNRTIVWEDLQAAMLLAISGLFKVFVIAYPLQSSAKLFSYYESNNLGVRWLELILFALCFFFNFAGYSDLAVAGARILGFDIGRNFNWPYTKTNPADFWNSWHMSLTHFFQRNVYVPLGGMRQKTQYRAIFLTIMAIALWHNISIPLVVFGLYHASGLIGHRWLSGKRPASPDQPRALTITKAFAMFLFFAFSLPLMVISANQILPVYASLVGLK